MLYYFLFSLHEKYGFLNVFRYQTFRSMLAFLLTFILVLIFQPYFIKWIQKRGIKGQPIREHGPESHAIKKGVPTMGGLVIVLSVLISTLLLADLSSKLVWCSLFILVSYATLGFLDDWSKVTKQDTKGVSGKFKLFWQIILAGIVAFILYYSGFDTSLTFPFFKTFTIKLGLLFIPFVILVVVGTSNSVNLTDGLDGLAIGSVMTVAATYGIFSYLVGHSVISEYLGFINVTGSGELCIILASVVAGGLGFLWYNTFPAQVFMGDLGALSLGGLLGIVAVLVKHEVLLIIAGGIFVVEALSVMIQVYSFKLTGKRVFKMAPIHHHFELKGWAEPKVIVRFWIISIVLALISLTTLKLR